jgi:sterol 14-demethylase
MLFTWFMLRGRVTPLPASAQPFISVESTPESAGKVALLISSSPGVSALAAHTKRLLLERGFKEVRDVVAAAGNGDAFQGADLAVHLAYEERGASNGGTEWLLGACAKHGVGNVILCSDALVGYDPAGDVTDGDERWDAGPSLERLTPRVPVVATGRLLALRRAEDAVARHHEAGSTKSGSVILRLHRVYSPSSAAVGSLLPLLLASGLGMLCAGTRALTNLTYAEDAAYGVVLAADKLLGGFAGVETVVLTDPTVWSTRHLLSCVGCVCRLPSPMLPLLLPLRLLSALLGKLGLSRPLAPLHAADTHCYFTGTKASKFLGFSPKASAKGLRATLGLVRGRCGLLLRLVAPLETIALTLALDALGYQKPTMCCGALAALLALYALVPPPKELPKQGPLYPPVVGGGLPMIGHLPAFMKGPVSMFDGLRSKYRSIFTIRVGPQRITMLVGADAQYAFIKAKDDMLDQASVYGFTIPVFGKGIIYDSPLDERLQQVKLLVHSMNTKSLEAMVPKMIDEAERYFAAWGEEGTVELRKVFSELIILTASSCLMGREIREGLSEDIARIYHDLDGGLTPLSTLWPSAPTAAHRDRDRARAEMEGIFSGVIAQRRSGAVREDDFLQKMIDFRYKDIEDPGTGQVLQEGRGFKDSEIVGLLVVLLFAGQHTSSITSTWLGARLLCSPEALAEVKAEQERLCPDKEALTYRNLMEMEAMRRSVTEALRLYPPLVLLMRKVLKPDFKVGALTIPKGDIVGVCCPATNLDPRYWHDPTEFKPSRFAPGGAEADTFDSRFVGHGVLQGLMMAFGGGAHMCSGRRFGFLQVTTIWTILLRDFDMEMTTPLPKPAYNDMVVGPDGPINVKYKRKTKKAAVPPSG